MEDENDKRRIYNYMVGKAAEAESGSYNFVFGDSSQAHGSRNIVFGPGHYVEGNDNVVVSHVPRNVVGNNVVIVDFDTRAKLPRFLQATIESVDEALGYYKRTHDGVLTL